MASLLLLLCAVFLLVDEAKPKVAVRLVDGKTPNEGRVEVRYNGTWGTICNYGNWDIPDAYVVCHMLNYSKAVTATTAIVKGTGRIWLKVLYCSGSQESIDQCPHGGWGNTADCDHSRDTGVVCGNAINVNVRLVDGKTPNEGRVEVRYNGTWGTICNDAGNWGIQDAYVVCHMLNYSKAVTATTASVKGTGPIWLKLRGGGCYGHEESIDQCRHRGWGNTTGCNHSRDAGVECGNLTPEEKAIKVRLVGDQNHTGKVEIQYQGTWGVVCATWGDKSWDIRDSHVICRMLGYKAAEHAIGFIEGETPRRTLLVDVGCSGREKSIAECAHPGWWKAYCSNQELAGVVCQTNEDPPPVHVRLAGGRSANSGRLEVRYHGQWGTVCESGWDTKDAEVVCRMLGYPGVQEYKTTNFTPVKGIIWLRYVGCTGRETSVADCSHSGWGNPYCYHSIDVGVTCKKVSVPRFKVSRESDGSPYTTVMLIFNTPTTEKEKNITKFFQISITKLEVSNLNCYRSSMKVDHPYVTAEILGSSLVGNFTVGDGNYYHGYYNAPLEPGSTYRVSVRAVTKAQNGSNNYGQAANDTFTTRVKDCKGFPQCPPEVKDEVTWSTTAVGKTDIQPCPGNATGQATRQCAQDKELKPRWDDVNVGNCTAHVFQKLLLEAYNSSLNSSGLLQELKTVTKTSPSEPKGLNGGDLDITTRILSTLVKNSKTDNTIDKNQPIVLEICSNILDRVNIKPWIQFESQRPKGTITSWNRLVVTVDEYGLLLTNHITANTNKVLTTKNIVMRVDKVGVKSKIRNQGLTFKHEQSSIFLPAEIFSNRSEYRVVSLVYKNLNYVMRLQRVEMQTDNGSVLVLSNTTMVSSIVRPEPTGKLKNHVKIAVENKKVVEPVHPWTCVFWRHGLPNVWRTDGCSLVTSESTKHITTCKCDHLTIFAALMDPYGGPLPLKHRKVLELISTIGCATSLFAILLTIIVMAYFWKALKGPRTIVLMNICVAIAVVCILVIAEGTARDTKVGCTVMAVLLHYFLLTVFCWMLCEGILLYLVIVKVIGAIVEEKVKWFLIFGWGFPAFVVGICLAATQTQGYGYHGNQTVCWLAVDNGLIWAFVAPAIAILLHLLITAKTQFQKYFL